METSGFFDRNKVPLSIIAGAVIVGGFIYWSRVPPEKLPFLGSRPVSPASTVSVASPTPAPVPPAAATPSLTLAPTLGPNPTATTVPTPVPTQALTPAPTAAVDDTAAIKSALMSKTGIAEDNLDFAVNKNTGRHATGLVRAKDAVGGGYWLAAKTDSGWVIVYDGQAQPPCSEVNAYGFPVDMAPECLNTAGEVVSR